MFSRLLSLFMFVPMVAFATTPAVEEGWIENGTHPLYYMAYGDGDPIVVLHGGPGFDHRTFLPHLLTLSRRHRVIFFDQRCTGLSGGPADPESVTVELFVEDIEAVRTYFGLEKMNLLGHSWGGILAMHYALAHEDRLKSLVLASTAATVESFGEMRAAYEAQRDAGDRELLEEIAASEAFQSGDSETVTRFWRIFFRPYFADPSRVEDMDLKFTSNTLANSRAVSTHILDSVGQFDLHERLANLKVPTLIVHGLEDPMHPRYARRIHDAIPNSELVLLKNSGHWIFIEDNEGFTRAVLEFLDGLE